MVSMALAPCKGFGASPAPYDSVQSWPLFGRSGRLVSTLSGRSGSRLWTQQLGGKQTRAYGIALRRADVRLPPKLPAPAQFALAQAVPFVEHLGFDDPVSAEMSEALTQLAPCD